MASLSIPSIYRGASITKPQRRNPNLPVRSTPSRISAAIERVLFTNSAPLSIEFLLDGSLFSGLYSAESIHPALDLQRNSREPAEVPPYLVTSASRRSVLWCQLLQRFTRCSLEWKLSTGISPEDYGPSRQ